MRDLVIIAAAAIVGYSLGRRVERRGKLLGVSRRRLRSR